MKPRVIKFLGSGKWAVETFSNIRMCADFREALAFALGVSDGGQ